MAEAIAPFQFTLTPIGYHKDDKVKEYADGLYKLYELGFEVLLDDRNIRPGVAFKDAELIGIPHRLVISSKLLENQELEYTRRKDL